MDLLGRTLIAVDYNISPVFLNPRLTEMDVRGPFTDSATSAEYPDLNIERFCQALSLAGDASIVCATNWTYIEPTEIFNVWGAYRGGSHTYFPGLAHRTGSVNVTQEDISEALAIYRGIQDLPPRVGIYQGEDKVGAREAGLPSTPMADWQNLPYTGAGGHEERSDLSHDASHAGHSREPAGLRARVQRFPSRGKVSGPEQPG